MSAEHEDSWLAPDFSAGVSLRQLRQQMIERLRGVGIDRAETEADLLLAWSLDCSQAKLILDVDRKIGAQARRRLLAAFERRLRREPLAYILGEWEFWSLPFFVSPAVLIPRPETELLVDQALKFALKSSPSPLRILDLGTGSGILAVVLARELPEAKLVAVDRSYSALAMARRNVRRHGVAERIFLLSADWLTAFSKIAFFDLVVANPPYVADRDLPTLQPEVRDFEPRQALSGGERGLAEISKLCRQLPAILAPGALLLMEIGWDQGEDVRRLFSANPHYAEVEILPDLAGLPRVLKCVRRKNKVSPPSVCPA